MRYTHQLTYLGQGKGHGRGRGMLPRLGCPLPASYYASLLPMGSPGFEGGMAWLKMRAQLPPPTGTSLPAGTWFEV